MIRKRVLGRGSVAAERARQGTVPAGVLWVVNTAGPKTPRVAIAGWPLPLYSMADQLSWAQSERALCLGILQGFFQGYFSKDIFRGMYWKWKIRAYRYSFQFQ